MFNDKKKEVKEVKKFEEKKVVQKYPPLENGKSSNRPH